MRGRRFAAVGLTLGIPSLAAIIGGLIVIPLNPLVGAWLLFFGGIFVLVGLVCIIALALAGRLPPSNFTAGQRREIRSAVQISRYVRSGIGAFAGVAAVVVGIVAMVLGAGFGVWVIGFGILLLLLAGCDFWIARRLSRIVEQSSQARDHDRDGPLVTPR